MRRYREHHIQAQRDELLQKIVEDMRPIAESSELTLTARCEGSPGVGTMVVDRRLITRALENLLDNAIRYTPRYG